MSNRPALYRPKQGVVLAGVCAGVAQRIGLEVTLVRILFAALTIMSSGLGIVLYLIGAVAIPRESDHSPTSAPAATSNFSSTFFGLIAAVVAIGISIYIFRDMPGWLIAVLVIALAFGFDKFRNKPRRQAKNAGRNAAGHPISGEPTPYERAAQTWQDRLARVKEAAATQDTSRIYSGFNAQVAVEEVEGRVVTTWRGWLFAFALGGIGVGITAAFSVMGFAIPNQVWPAVILLAFGITLIISTWKGRPRFMILTTVVVGVLTLGMAVAPYGAAQAAAVPGVSKIMHELPTLMSEGDTRKFYATSDVPSKFDQGVGNAVYDFDDIEFSGKYDQLVTEISHGVGSFTVFVPANVGYDIVWTVGVGKYTRKYIAEDGTLSDGNQDSGMGLSGSENNLVDDDTKPQVQIVLNVGVGELTVFTHEN
ncbi:MAG: PspC domain-containing protein [Propionibacteriaceae bacterium]|jgi:phage shock protein PspC (stress-responsive transcriptional regulator)|nr:PspC domain-containing protein [Propionibacteriaceae bacterium]